MIDGVNHTPAIDPETINITDAYVSDMLSDVMGSAKPDQAWITIMKHLNVIAVASMTGIPVIIFAKGNTPDDAVCDKALEESICLISSKLDTFRLAGLLYKALKL
jgi:predicted transcriptional regulator